MWMLQTPQWGLSVPVALAGVTVCEEGHSAGKETAQRTFKIFLCLFNMARSGDEQFLLSGFVITF